MKTSYVRYVNDPTTSEIALQIRSGSTVTVLGLVDPSTVDAEVEPMWWVQFADGYTAQAFTEELGSVPGNPTYYLGADGDTAYCLEHREELDPRYGCRQCPKEDNE